MMITIMTIMTMMQHMILLMKKVQHLSKTKPFAVALQTIVHEEVEHGVGVDCKEA